MVALETEEIGTQVLSNLQQQKETIIHTRDNLNYADENIDHSSKILKDMNRRLQTNKLITAFIVIVLLAIIGVVIYLAVNSN